MASLLSVIVPVYNVAEFLPRCIESIVNQTYKNLEILLIDDGSSDNSAQICNNYAEHDSRIKVIHKKNGGQGSARNVGLSLCRGEYITFVDSDDWLAEDIYEHSMNLINENNVDIASFNCIETKDETVRFEESENQLQIVKKENILKDYLYRGQTDRAPFTVWRKIYRKDILEDIQFDENRINEDITFNFKALAKAEKLIHTSKIGYYYFQGNKSTTRNGLKKRDFDLLYASEELMRLTQLENNKEIIHLAYVKKARSFFSLLAKIAMYGFEDSDLNKKNTIKTLQQNLRKELLLLLKSPMPLGRKIMAITLAIDVRLLSFPLKIYKKLTK